MKNKKKLITNIILTLIYALFTLLIVLHHEIWADEAQVWMIVKNVSFIELFQHLVNEGHPSFFYLLMMPFAKSGFSIFVMQFICWLSNVVAVFLLLQFSPFSKFAKFAIITSAGFIYFLPVMARSYSIVPLLVFGLAILYPKAKEKPCLYALLLIILANTHVIMFLFCAVLAMFFFWDNVVKNTDIEDKKSFYVPFTVMVVGLCSVVLQLSGTTSSNAFITIDFANLFSNTIKVFSEFFINSFDAGYIETGDIIFPNIGTVLIFLSVVLYTLFFIILLKRDKRMFSLAFLGIGFQIAVYIFGYSHFIYVTRIFCAHLIMLFCFWILLKNDNFEAKKNIFDQKFINITIALFFIFTFINGFKFALSDLFNPYSGAKETAEFIEKNIDKDKSILVTDNAAYAMALVYYLDGKYDIYSARSQKSLKYVVWNKDLYHVLGGQNWKQYADYVKKNNENFKNKNFYAIVPDFNLYKLKVVDINDFDLLFKSKPAILKFEGFRVLKYKF